MKQFLLTFLFLLMLLSVASNTTSQTTLPQETPEAYKARMQWWNEARFGLFIHWGLYSVPAGEWKGETGHAEWIRTTAHIPLDEYDNFRAQFNPQQFDPDAWVRMAKDAGMNYIVITSKHHDGFCLFDSKYTDFDVMSTPYQRDILKQLAEACKRGGIKLCFYYSIMDWHHPDYLPRRDWETTRTTAGADFSRFIQYEKNQLKELLTNYGDIGVLWFDGNFDGNWNNEYGKEYYSFVRSLQPNIIVNDRVGRQSGLTFTEKDIVGDYRTPEQMIPATGLPDTYWETCMTMNDHWGYNSHDNNFKSTKELIQKLSDIASKGGNFLLNIGPTAQGLFPESSVVRLKDIGRWMKTNSEAIYGTSASPFSNLPWGRCTKKTLEGKTRLYLHVFDYPPDKKLIIPGIANTPEQAYLLADVNKNPLPIERMQDALIIHLPAQAPDENNTVVALDISGVPDVAEPPTISAPYPIFIDKCEVTIQSSGTRGEVHYTLDGSEPTTASEVASKPITLHATTTVIARWFRDGNPLSQSAKGTFSKVVPIPAVHKNDLVEGIHYQYFEGAWDSLPAFEKMKPTLSGTLHNFSLTPIKQQDHFGFEFTGYIAIDKDDVYSFYTSSDDGSQLFIGDSLVVDNNYLHPMQEEEGVIALSAGFHPIKVTFFENTGDQGLEVRMKSMTLKKEIIPDTLLYKEKE